MNSDFENEKEFNDEVKESIKVFKQNDFEYK
jgi:hypothetical protein